MIYVKMPDGKEYSVEKIGNKLIAFLAETLAFFEVWELDRSDFGELQRKMIQQYLK